MSPHVFVVLEWMPKENCEEKLWVALNKVMESTQKESGCIRTEATRQIPHPAVKIHSSYNIVLLQAYVDVGAFDSYCNAEYVKRAFEGYVDSEETGPVQEWTLRLFSNR